VLEQIALQQHPPTAATARYSGTFKGDYPAAEKAEAERAAASAIGIRLDTKGIRYVVKVVLGEPSSWELVILPRQRNLPAPPPCSRQGQAAEEEEEEEGLPMP